MAQEIERKFLVKDDSYRRLAYRKSRVEQGYICSERGRTVRVRIRDGKDTLQSKDLPMRRARAAMNGSMKSR